MPNYQLSQLDQLEAEAIFILRETAAQFENPALLFSGGKDSTGATCWMPALLTRMSTPPNSAWA